MIKKILSLSSILLLLVLKSVLAAPSFSIDLDDPYDSLSVSAEDVIKVTYTVHNRSGSNLSDLSFRHTPITRIDPIGTSCESVLGKHKTCKVRLLIGPIKGQSEEPLTLNPLTVCAFKGAWCTHVNAANRINIKFGQPLTVCTAKNAWCTNFYDSDDQPPMPPEKFTTPLAYVLIDATSNNVKVINTSTQTVVKQFTISSTNKPKDIAMAPNGVAYVTVPTTKSVHAVQLVNDVVSISDAILVGGASAALIRINPYEGKAYISGTDTNQMRVININTNEALYPALKSQITAVDFLPIAGFVYIATSQNFGYLDYSDGGLSIIRSFSQVVSLSADQRAGVIYAVSTANKNLAVINAVSHTITATKTFTNLAPQSVVVSPDGNRVYVLAADTSASNAPKLLVINPTDQAIIQTIALPTAAAKAPLGMAVTPDSQWIYVVCKDGVRVINAAEYTVSAPITLSSTPLGPIAISPRLKVKG